MVYYKAKNTVLKISMKIKPKKKINFFHSAKKTFSKEIDSLSQLSKQISSKNFNGLCEKILLNKGNLFLMGIGKSGNIAEKICSTLSSTGTPAIYINAAEASHGDLGAITKKDILLIFSYSGETDEILKILPACKRKAKDILSITGNSKSTLSINSNVSLTIEIDQEACPMDLAPTTSSTAMLLLGDALAISLLEAKGFSPQDFAENHPGGSLGKKFLKVKDLMLSKKNLPTLSESSSVYSAIYLMSSKGLGLTLIESKNKISGIFTDGDLRRLLDKKINLDDLKIKEVMTIDFKFVSEEVLVSEAIKSMEKFKIFSLLVKNSKDQITGLLRMHDVLEAKII